MKHRFLWLLLVLVTCAVSSSAQNPQQLFTQALTQERAAGNLEQAIELYQRVAKDTTDRSLAAQAATVVDSQLLFRQTQKRAERESVINLIAQKIQSATSVEGAIQTAVRELGQAFKARRAVVELGNDESPKNGK